MIPHNDALWPTTRRDPRKGNSQRRTLASCRVRCGGGDFRGSCATGPSIEADAVSQMGYEARNDSGGYQGRPCLGQQARTHYNTGSLKGDLLALLDRLEATMESGSLHGRGKPHSHHRLRAAASGSVDRRTCAFGPVGDQSVFPVVRKDVAHPPISRSVM